MSLSVSLPAALSGKVVLGVTVAALATSGAGAAAITAATSSHQQSRPATSAAAHESTGSNQSQAAFGQSVADKVESCRAGSSNVGLCVSDYARNHNPGATNRPAGAGKPATTGSDLNPTSAPPTTPVGSPDSHPTGAPVSHPGPTDHPGRP